MATRPTPTRGSGRPPSLFLMLAGNAAAVARLNGAAARVRSNVVL
jgi:hypothetical protein